MARSSTSGKGRPKGALNKVTRDVRALAGEHSEACIRTLAHIAGDDQQPTAARVAAIRELLLRAHGQPSARIEAAITGTSPVEQGQSALQAAIDGKLPIDQLSSVMGALGSLAKLIEVGELTRRLDQIERLLSSPRSIHPEGLTP